MSRKNTLIILCGISGSGKSTFRDLLCEGSMYGVCPDLIRKCWYGDESIQGNGNQVFEYAYSQIQMYGDRKDDCVFDATNTTKKARKKVLEIARPHFDFILCYYFVPDLFESQKRNLNRERQVPLEIIYKQYKQWQTPTFDEGFDYICEIKY